MTSSYLEQTPRPLSVAREELAQDYDNRAQMYAHMAATASSSYDRHRFLQFARDHRARAIRLRTAVQFQQLAEGGA